MSESFIPTERMSESTLCEPALVEPPSQTSSAFADLLSECVSIDRRRESICEPGDGSPEREARTVAAIASLRVEAAGKRAAAFQAVPLPEVRFSTYTAAVPP
jgi:hypothetical protein